ncbi:MAG TPA: glycosyltransferase family 4 protein [Verrucomicrobiae bacterium]|jgi:glycosyltransferase involved in cell wall biosynthesis
MKPSPPLRILQASAEPIANLGGVGKIVQWVSGELVKHHRVSLAAPDACSSEIPAVLAERLENRITIPAAKWDAASRRQFVQQIKSGNYDLVHFHGGTFSFDSHLPWRSPLHRLGRQPWILSNHYVQSLTAGLFPAKYPRAGKLLKSALAWTSKAYLLARSRQEVFDSDENRGLIGKWFPWAKSKMRTIYHSGLEGSPPGPALAPEVVTIANLGHIAWRKGQPDLLTAFSLVRPKFPRLKLVLAGPLVDEDCTQWMRNEIRRLNLGGAVLLPGGLNDKAAFWPAVDIYVQPSRFEGAPIALMEALWMGKPAIGTRVSGIPEIIEDEMSGLLVESGRPEAMAAAIERLIFEFDTRRRFSEHGPRRIQAQGMTRAQMSRNYAELYDAVLSR